MNERTEPAGSFEEALERLEDSVDRLESGNLSLADALDVFEEGIAASRTCTRWLDQTRKRVEVLLADDTGALHLSFLDEDEDLDNEGLDHPAESDSLDRE